MKNKFKNLTRTEARILLIVAEAKKPLTMTQIRTAYLERWGELLPRQEGVDEELSDTELLDN